LPVWHAFYFGQNPEDRAFFAADNALQGFFCFLALVPEPEFLYSRMFGGVPAVYDECESCFFVEIVGEIQAVSRVSVLEELENGIDRVEFCFLVAFPEEMQVALMGFFSSVFCFRFFRGVFLWSEHVLWFVGDEKRFGVSTPVRVGNWAFLSAPALFGFGVGLGSIYWLWGEELAFFVESDEVAHRSCRIEERDSLLERYAFVVLAEFL